MRRKDKEIKDRTQIDEIISGCDVCHLGLADGGEPYIVPISYGYDKKHLYFHTALRGKKLDIIAANPRVCVQFERNVHLLSDEIEPCKWTFLYESVIGNGVVQEIVDEESKAQGLNQITRHYSVREWRLSSEVLARTRVWRVVVKTFSGKRSVREQVTVQGGY